MTRSERRPRLSVVPAAEPRPMSEQDRELYRETDIRLAAEGLFKIATHLHAIPRYPDLAEYRRTYVERFEEAVKVMKDALHE